MKTSVSGANHADFHSQISSRSLGPIEASISDQKGALLHAKATNEGWDP